MLIPYACGSAYSVNFDGNNYFLTWQSDSVKCKRISENGFVIDSPSIFIADSKIYNLVDAYFDGENQLVLLRNKDSLAVAIVQPNAGVKEIITFSAPKQDLSLPAIVSPKKGYFSIVYSGWEDSVNNKPVYAYRLKGYSYNYNSTQILTVKDKIYNTFSLNLKKKGRQVIINYNIPESILKKDQISEIKLKIFNNRGQIIKSFNKSINCATNNIIIWNRMAATGKTVSNGVYFVRAEIGGYNYIGKISLY